DLRASNPRPPDRRASGGAARVSGVDGSVPGAGAPGSRTRLGRLSGLVPRGGLRHAVAIIAGGQALAALVVALAYPIITRLYDPAQFGAFAALVSLLSIALTVSCLTYDQAIPLPEREDLAFDLVVMSLLCTVALTCLCALVMILFGRELLAH